MSAMNDIEEIKKLFAARLRCMDTKDWDHYGDFHTEDVVSDRNPLRHDPDKLTAALLEIARGQASVVAVDRAVDVVVSARPVPSSSQPQPLAPVADAALEPELVSAGAGGE